MPKVYIVDTREYCTSCTHPSDAPFQVRKENGEVVGRFCWKHAQEKRDATEADDGAGSATT